MRRLVGSFAYTYMLIKVVAHKLVDNSCRDLWIMRCVRHADHPRLSHLFQRQVSLHIFDRIIENSFAPLLLPGLDRDIAHLEANAQRISEFCRWQ